MEFLRFGSRIPGAYWGCCAMCIIQDFKQDPDAKSSIQIVSGDSGAASGDKFFGPTYRDIFKSRIRAGTFGGRDMPNHGFLAILTASQCSKENVGYKWLQILKEEGFEFIRAVDNSVYTGENLGGTSSAHPNYLFGLFRNIGNSAIKNPFAPPANWADLPPCVPEAYQFLNEESVAAINDQQKDYQTARWKDGKTVYHTKAEIKKLGAPVVLAGHRTDMIQQTEEQRAALQPKAAVNNASAAFPASG